MVRKAPPQPLQESRLVNHDDPDFIDRSPLSPISPKSPKSPFRFISKKPQSGPSANLADAQSNQQASSTASSIASLQDSESQEKERPQRTGFFSKNKATKGSSRLQHSNSTDAVKLEGMSRDSPAMSGKVSSKDNSRNDMTDRGLARRPVGSSSKSDVPLESSESSPQSSSSTNINRKNKPKAFSLLSRTRSLRDEESPTEDTPPNKHLEVENQQKPSQSTKAASTESDRSLRGMMGSGVRQNSQDRVPPPSRDRSQEKRQKESSYLRPKDHKEPSRSQSNMNPQSSSRDLSATHSSLSSSQGTGGGHSFFNNFKSSAAKGAGALSKGLFNKSGRSGSSTEREPTIDDEHYVIKVLNTPLVQQTRLTRISKKLEDSRDKTEFWMPAFPWRAIDYLNYKGSDVEGLYRVPGSGPQIKKWQRRFDQEHDIDLFEEKDLYDINIIGSMLKAWLRELPDVLLPKAAQDRIARECSGAETVPQLLIDELSNLSPFNYYLLFAITCHLSLLLAHSEKNKMDYRNLCICFQPCMKIDAFCFKFLVCDWRDCWKGCKTEEQYIQQEYMLFDMIPPSSAEGRSSTAIESPDDERMISSSGSSKPSSVSVPPSKSLPLSSSQDYTPTANTTFSITQDQTPPRASNDMRPLSPIKPLSPIGF